MAEQQQQQRQQLIRMRILRRRRLRDINDPFAVTEEAFRATYRLSRQLARDVIELIRPYIPVTVSPLALPLELKFLCVLHFFANGSYQMPNGANMDVCVAQSTVSGYIAEVVSALNRPQILGRFIKFPRTQEEVNAVMERNKNMGGKLPNVIGLVDGSLIKIMKPPVAANRQAYIGRKSYASINVLFTCDRRLLFLNVLARYPGATNDSFIFANSALRRTMEELNRTQPCILIGDSGFALEPWLMVPFARNEQPEENTPEARFNRDLVQDRCHIERAIGTLKERFRAINDERVLHYTPVKACEIVLAVSVLHNLCILSRVPQYVVREGHNAVNNLDLQDVEDDNALVRGRARRAQIVQLLEDGRRA